MANNERVSQLAELFASDLQPDDVLLATDTSQKESKKIEIGQLLLFIESSGSFFTYISTYCKTASYIEGYNVDGYVRTALNASHSVSASWADRAGSSSYALSASWAPVVTNVITSDTASFLRYVGTPNGTASYAMNALNSLYSSTASFLQYIPGGNNGTSSYAISSSVSISSSFSNFSISSSYTSNSFTSVSSSWASSSISSYFSSASVSASWASQSISASYAQSASYLIGGPPYQPIKAWAYVTWSSVPAGPSIVTNYNISSLTFVGRYTTSGYYWDQFAVTFTTPLLNTNYTLIGIGGQPHSPLDSPGVALHPVYGNRTVSSFTMSILNDTTANFYSINTSAPPADRYGYVSFQILGL